jgi:phosphoribosyl 1,2-cyclic phosphodiesterase
MTDQMRREYFPVTLFELAADIEFTSLEDTPMDLTDQIKVHWMPLFHPGMCFGYRFEYKDKVVVYATDTELFQEPGLAEVNLVSIMSFIKNADVLIYDAQYTLKEYLLNKVGWGHSAIEEVIDVCIKSNVKHLFAFHHDPNHNDEFIDNMIERLNIYQDEGLFVSAAREGLEILL